MRKSKFTESQIVTTLKQVEGGRQVKDVCRDLGISEATYYRWKSKYGGMEASDVQRLRDIEVEHAKLKRMYTRGRPRAEVTLRLAGAADRRGGAMKTEPESFYDVSIQLFNLPRTGHHKIITGVKINSYQYLHAFDTQ